MADRIVITSRLTNSPMVNVDGEVVWYVDGSYAMRVCTEQFGTETLHRVTLMPENREFMYTFESQPTCDPYVDEFPEL